MNCMISVVRRMLLNIRFTFSDIDLMDKKYWLVINATYKSLWDKSYGQISSLIS